MQMKRCIEIYRWMEVDAFHVLQLVCSQSFPQLFFEAPLDEGGFINHSYVGNVSYCFLHVLRSLNLFKPQCTQLCHQSPLYQRAEWETAPPLAVLDPGPRIRPKRQRLAPLSGATVRLVIKCSTLTRLLAWGSAARQKQFHPLRGSCSLQCRE